MCKRYGFLISVLLLFASLTPPVLGQAILLYQKDGAAAGDGLGISVAGTGDVNGDGKSDFIVGASLAQPGGMDSAGSAYLYSGIDGTLLFQINAFFTDIRLGEEVAGAGDVNGDGKADFIIGAPGGFNPFGPDSRGLVYVYSGATGTLLHEKQGSSEYFLGTSVAGAGDINGDGKADFIVGALRMQPFDNTGAGSAYVYSGSNGSLLYQMNGSADNIRLGSSVDGCGDINGDGRPDFIVGAPLADPGGLSDAGSAFVYSGANGFLLYQINGSAAGDRLGNPVAGSGDVNGDGKADFIVGAPGADPGGRSYAGSAYIYSGADGSLLFQKNGEAAGDGLGGSVAEIGDVNGDSKPDFAIGAGGADPGGFADAGSVYVYSGVDGSLLCQINGSTAGDLLNKVSGAGDINCDGMNEIIVGAPGADPAGLSSAGSAYVYTLPCPAAKGDMDGDTFLTATDVMLMLNCVFLGTGSCSPCFSDVNCDGNRAPADVVIELNAVFLASPFPC